MYGPREHGLDVRLEWAAMAEYLAEYADEPVTDDAGTAVGLLIVQRLDRLTLAVADLEGALAVVLAHLTEGGTDAR